MNDQEGEPAGIGRLEVLGWRSIAAGAGLLAAGLVVGATLFGDVGETPCYEVEEQAQPARDVVSATFGGGEEGRQAIRDLLEFAQDHPGCFDPAEVRLLQDHLESASGEPETEEATVVPTESVTPSS